MTPTPAQRRRAAKRDRQSQRDRRTGPRPDHDASAVRVVCASCGRQQSDTRVCVCGHLYGRYA